MSNTHESLKLAELLSTGKFFRASEIIRTQHALIVQMAEALDWLGSVYSDPTLSHERDPEIWLPSITAATSAAKDYLK